LNLNENRVWLFYLTEKVLHSYSLFHNSKSLTENSKITDITIAHGLKVLGIINVVGGHQFVLDLATPAYNPDFSDHVWIINYNDNFYYLIIPGDSVDRKISKIVIIYLPK